MVQIDEYTFGLVLIMVRVYWQMKSVWCSILDTMPHKHICMGFLHFAYSCKLEGTLIRISSLKINEMNG